MKQFTPNRRESCRKTSPEWINNDNIAVGLEALDGELLDVHGELAAGQAQRCCCGGFQRVASCAVRGRDRTEDKQQKGKSR